MMKRPLGALLLILLFAAPARAAQCGGDFNVFLSAMGRDAQAAGLPRGIIDQAFAGASLSTPPYSPSTADSTAPSA
jgi:membrane-bound lytic murein transglycosylase B